MNAWGRMLAVIAPPEVARTTQRALGADRVPPQWRPHEVELLARLGDGEPIEALAEDQTALMRAYHALSMLAYRGLVHVVDGQVRLTNLGFMLASDPDSISIWEPR